jgi:hypothetical protein
VTPEARAWLAANPERHVPLHHGRVVLVEPDRDLVRDHHPPVDPPRHVSLRHRADRQDPGLRPTRNTQAKPFVWAATADEILAKVRFVQTNIKQLVDNNAK